MTEPSNPHERRHAILELSPLELDCMKALWSLPSQASVRQVQSTVASTKPRAYTTIMTILDRLARKGIVGRQKSGKAWLYHPNLSAEEARTHALAQVLDGFFNGSSDALAARLLDLPGTSSRPVPAANATISRAVEETTVTEAPVRKFDELGVPKEGAEPLDTSLL